MIVHALVARGTADVLAEHAVRDVAGNFQVVSRQILRKLPSSPLPSGKNDNEDVAYGIIALDATYAYHYLQYRLVDAYRQISTVVKSSSLPPSNTGAIMASSNPFDAEDEAETDRLIGNSSSSIPNLIVMILADRASTTDEIQPLLKNILHEFLLAHGDRAASAFAFSLNNQFAPTIERMVSAFNENLPRNRAARDRIMQVNQTAENVKSVMAINVERLLERGESIALLVEKSATLEESAHSFSRSSKHVRKLMWWRNVRFWIVFTIFILLLVFIITLIECGGPSLSSCK